MDPTEVELAFLRCDLGFLAPDETTLQYMEHLITAARRELTAKGIDLIETDADDISLVVMYAAWLYRKRDSGTMSDMLRYAIYNHKTRMRGASG